MSAEETADARPRVGRYWVDVVCVACTWVVGTALFLRLDAVQFPIVGDGVVYYQAAENFAAGRGFTHSVQAPENYATDAQAPLTLWPPGLPFGLAVLRLAGADPFVAAVWLPRACWLALVPLCVVLFRITGAGAASGLLAAYCALSPGVFGRATRFESDVPFLLLVVSSFLLLYAGCARRSFALVAASGFAAGCAYAVRNAGIALAAVPLALLVGAALSRDVRRERVGQTIAWVLGILPIVTLLKVRTLLVFGVLEPYKMPPSTIGYVANIRWLVNAFARDLTANETLSFELAWNMIPFLVVSAAATVCAAVLIGFWFRSTLSSEPSPHSRSQLGMALLAYSLLGVLVVLVARSKYDWKEVIGPRHAAQYSLLLLSLAVGGFVPLTRSWRRATGVGLLVLLAVVALCRAPYLLALASTPPSPLVAVAADAEGLSAVQRLPADAFVLSNDGPVLALLTGRDVRHVFRDSDTSDRPFDATLQQVVEDLGTSRPVYFVLVEEPQKATAKLPPSFVPVTQCPHLVVYTYAPTGG